MKAPEISLVIPCHNEQDNLQPLLSAIHATLDPLGLDFEVVITDDCSTDNSCQSWAEFESLMDAASKPSWREIAIIFGVLALVCVCGMLWGQSSRETSEGRGTQASGAPFHFWRSTAAVTVGAICLVAGPSVATWTLPGTKELIGRLHGRIGAG